MIWFSMRSVHTVRAWRGFASRLRSDEAAASSLPDDFMSEFSVITKPWPNTALEPTADSAFSFTGSVGFGTPQFGGGSAFGR